GRVRRRGRHRSRILRGCPRCRTPRTASRSTRTRGIPACSSRRSSRRRRVTPPTFPPRSASCAPRRGRRGARQIGRKGRPRLPARLCPSPCVFSCDPFYGPHPIHWEGRFAVERGPPGGRRSAGESSLGGLNSFGVLFSEPEVGIFKPFRGRGNRLAGKISTSESIWRGEPMKIEGCEFPNDLLYDPDGLVWCRPDSGEVTIGITGIYAAVAGRIAKVSSKPLQVAYPSGTAIGFLESPKHFGPIRTPIGDVVHLVTDDGTAPIEMVRWSDETGQPVIDERREGNLFHFLVRKVS